MILCWTLSYVLLRDLTNPNNTLSRANIKALLPLKIGAKEKALDPQIKQLVELESKLNFSLLLSPQLKPRGIK